MASLGDDPVPLSSRLPEHRPIGISHILRPSCLPDLCCRAATSGDVGASRSGGSGRDYVGARLACFSDCCWLDQHQSVEFTPPRCPPLKSPDCAADIEQFDQVGFTANIATPDRP